MWRSNDINMNPNDNKSGMMSLGDNHHMMMPLMNQPMQNMVMQQQPPPPTKAPKESKKSKNAISNAKRRKKAAEEGKPKRPKNAFLFFVEDTMPSLQGDQTTKLRAAGEMWRGLDEESKQPYLERANQAASTYKDALAHFNETVPPKVKRPLSSFMRFSVERRQFHMSNGYVLDSRDAVVALSRMIADEWQKLDPALKQHYKEQWLAESKLWQEQHGQQGSMPDMKDPNNWANQ